VESGPGNNHQKKIAREKSTGTGPAGNLEEVMRRSGKSAMGGIKGIRGGKQDLALRENPGFECESCLQRMSFSSITFRALLLPLVLESGTKDIKRELGRVQSGGIGLTAKNTNLREENGSRLLNLTHGG